MTYELKPLPKVDLPPLRQVGKPLRRIDALGKTTGATVYAGDYTMPKMLHARVFRSSEPSARIKRLDVSSAQALAGVACGPRPATVPAGRAREAAMLRGRR